MNSDRDRIEVRHRQSSVDRLRREGFAHVIDVTSGGVLPWRRFSPFFPHGGIPVPGWPGRTAASVEGIWQGLKRFEHEDVIDEAVLDNTSMRNIKRSSRARGRSGTPRGRVLGHQWGEDREALLGYMDARLRIYIPSFLWVLEHRLGREVALLREMVREGSVALLDYTTNADVAQTARPLSHAALIRAYLLEHGPDTVASYASAVDCL